ncbi:hypothetical protein F5X68DRAFT_273492 [Plectosphaerella plurivora]|uniref:Uncharacterized protein n=1 Tax=Plectosphaerella plurivora TaxID=936078 RepID=A0A9P8VJ82_9PEZI|nr:hypothetical protein F5X68DRAFT_273492 [Plectosphaerella plurivora]
MEAEASSTRDSRQETIEELQSKLDVVRARLARRKNNRQCPPTTDRSTDRAPPGADSLLGEECHQYVGDKMRNGISRQEARRDWIQSRFSARIEAKKQAQEAARKAADPAGEVMSSPDDMDPRTDMTLREAAGRRVPLPARMMGETAEAYERRELQAAEDFIAGTYDDPDEEEKSKGERRVIKAKRRVRWQMNALVHPKLREIDWQVVVKRFPRSKNFPEEMMVKQPTPRATYAAKTLKPEDAAEKEEVHGYPVPYLIFVGTILNIIDNPRPLEDVATARVRIKLAYLESLGAKVTEDWEWAQGRLGGAALTQAGEETRWKLQILQELAKPMARTVWEAARERDLARGRGEKLVYREGLPVDLRAPMPRLVGGEWTSRRGVVCLWSPCLQCKVAGAGECNSARFLSRKAENKVCHRCHRQGLACVRGDDDSSEESLAKKGVQRWETYEGADPTSMTAEEAQAIAKELLEARGKKLINVCGVMVDLEDAKGFAPAPEKGPSISAWQQRREEEDEEMQKSTWVSKEALARGDEFAKRMAMMRCDEYWQEKASTGEIVMREFDGVKRRALRERVDDEDTIPKMKWAI